MRRAPLRSLSLVCVVWLTTLLAADVLGQSRMKRVPRDIEPGTAAIGRHYAVRDLIARGRRPPRQPLRPPLVLERNEGQAPPGFAFVMRSVGFAAGLTRTGWTAAVFSQPSDAERDGGYGMKGYALRFTFRGARPARLAGGAAAKGGVRYASGAAATAQRIVPAFNTVTYDNLYPGVQAAVHGRDGRFEYGFVLEPAANPAVIRIGVDGVSRLELGARGALLMHTPSGTIAQTRPRAFELTGSERRPLKARFVILSRNEYGFAVDGRRPGTRIVIDPEVVFTSYFGGSGNEGTLEPDGGASDLHGQGFDIVVAPEGHVFVVGTTASPDFPVTAVGPLQGSSDAFVLRLDPTAAPGDQLVYATYLGGPSFERGVSLAPAGGGRVYVTGCTTSASFPASSGVVTPAPTASVGYVVRLTAEGALDVGTRIGTTSQHHPASIAFSQAVAETEGFVYVAGSAVVPPAGSTGDAVPGAFQTEHRGGTFDGFVAKLDANLTQYQYFTYLGGTGSDLVMDLAVNDGFAFVTGSTASLDFPTTELATQGTHSQVGAAVDCSNPGAARQCFDAFVTRLNRAGTAPIYSTYIGGDAEEFGRGLAIGAGPPNNQATLVGAARPTSGTDTEILILRLEASGENILWEERLDGSRRDHGEEVVVDAFGRAHVVGTVSRDGLSTSASSFQGGAGDMFYSRHDAATGATEYFTYIGGSGEERGFAVAARGASIDNFCALVAGSTTSEDVATVNPLEGGEANRGGADLLLVTTCDIDLDITSGGFSKSANPSSVVAARSGATSSGGTTTFTITVQNDGDVPGPVTVTDTVPGSLTVTGVAGPGCQRTQNVVTCQFNAEPGATAITIAARAGTDCPRTLTNTATVQVGSQSIATSTSVQVTCPPPLCPNGQIDPGEECDSGPGCRADCTLAECGDGIVDPGEACDDGNASNGDRCTTQCRRRTIEGDTCGEDLPQCAGDLVCGRRCGIVEECWFIFCDTYLLCSVPDECMPADEATFTSGP